MKYRLTIITVVKNDINGIKDTIESCILQKNNNNIQYIVINSKSTDGTSDVIDKYLEDIDYYINENDSSIYNAMNKGLSLARGEWCIFMNSGDYFLNSNSVSMLGLDNKSDFFVIACSYIEHSNLGPINIIHKARNSIKYSLPSSHQAILVKTKIAKTICFQEQYKIGADYDLIVKILKKNINKLCVLRVILCSADNSGFGRNVSLFKKDYHKIIYYNFGLLRALKYIILEKIAIIYKK